MIDSSGSNSEMQKFEPFRPSQADQSLWDMSGLQKYARHSGELAGRHEVFEA
jgi:hypothetical protein